MSGQLTYGLDHVVATPGQIGDASNAAEYTSFPASEAIPFGRFVEVPAGGTTCRLPQGTGQEINGLVGVSVYRDAMPPGGYQIGDEVTILRRGRIWVEFNGTGATELEDARVKHSSTIVTHRGKATDAAADGTATTEISGVNGKFRGANSLSTVALVEINLPGAV